MKTTLEQDDIQAIAAAVVDRLTPLFSGKESNIEPIIFDTPGLCAYLHVSRKWVFERTHLKEIPYIKLSNKQLRFRKKDIDKWLDSLSTPAIEQYRGKLSMVR